MTRTARAIGYSEPNTPFAVCISPDGNQWLRKWTTMRGIKHYYWRYLIRALDFVMANRDRFPFKDIVDSQFSRYELDEAFEKAGSNSVLCVAIVP